MYFLANFAEMKAIYLLPLALLSFSCARNVSTAEPPIPYVSGIIADASSAEHRLVSSFNSEDPLKSIFILGTPAGCEALRTQLLKADAYDNVDGRRNPDGLPDFSGELICTIVDFAHVPYQSYVDDKKLDELRELNVRTLLSAMDTLCYVNEFDSRGLAAKPLPKLLVMASPFAAKYGKYDIDSLFSALGCRLPVIYPLNSMLEKLRGGRQGEPAIGVIASAENLRSGAFSSFVAFPADSSAADPLLAFLDSCMASGNSRPLDAIIIDDPEVDADLVRQTLRRITISSNHESLSYGQLIAPGCTVQDMESTVSDECYRLLRAGNLFTHRIAYPRSLEFKTVATDSSAFVLTPYDNGDPLR